MILTVVLGASSEASFDIVLRDNSFVKKWTKEFEWCLDNCEFNQQESFAEWMSVDQAQNLVLDSCAVINRYLPGFIKSTESSWTQQYLNYLHHCFEQLSGTFESPSRLFVTATPELKQAIRQLNFFVHRIETEHKKIPNLYFGFDKDQYRRFPLEDSDYQYAEVSIEPGTLILHYAELGKEYVDLFEDGLDLDYSGFRNLHYYSGEALLSFSGYNPLNNENFRSWLTQRGIDPYNKRLGHLRIPLGKVLNIDDALDKITKYQYINKILIKE